MPGRNLFCNLIYQFTVRAKTALKSFTNIVGIYFWFVSVPLFTVVQCLHFRLLTHPGIRTIPDIRPWYQAQLDTDTEFVFIYADVLWHVQSPNYRLLCLKP